MTKTTQRQFTKVKNFIQSQASQPHNVMITEISGGFRVNEYTVQKQNANKWVVMDSRGVVTQSFKTGRLALLSATMTAKRRFDLLQAIATADQRLDMLKHDVDIYRKKVAANPERYVLLARLSAAEKNLADIKGCIRQYERSVGLAP